MRERDWEMKVDGRKERCCERKEDIRKQKMVNIIVDGKIDQMARGQGM